MAEALIIEVAVNGWMTKAHLPLSPVEVRNSIAACFEAGAQAVNVHAGDPFVDDVKRYEARPCIFEALSARVRHPVVREGQG